MTWQDRKVAVTGAAGGIGAALCRRLAAAGARVYALDSSPERLAGLESGGNPVCRVLDITDQAAVAAVFAELGPLDVLVNNAGLTSLGPLATTPVEAIDRVLDVNLRGSIYCTRAALAGLIERQGRIGVMSSVAGFAPLIHRTAYSASKHGLHGFFESLRAELVGTGVTVTMVCPTFTRTGIEARAAHRAEDAAGGWSTTGSIMEPDDLARRILEGLARRRRLILPTSTSRLSYALWRLSPRAYDAVMRRQIGTR